MSISPLGPFAVFVSTPPAVVEGMMDLAQVGPNDVVYDGDWKPERLLKVEGRTIYLWTITPELAATAQSTQKLPPNQEG